MSRQKGKKPVGDEKDESENGPASDESSDHAFSSLFADDPDLERTGGMGRVSIKPQRGRRRPRDPEPEIHAPTGSQTQGNGTSFSNGVPRATMLDLRAGRIRPETRIDLHRLDRQQAQRALHRAFSLASAQGQRCVLVIHGKGASSMPGHETLKSALPGWLTSAPLSDLVAACAGAVAGDGGDGASYVLLRKSAAERRSKRSAKTGRT